MTPFMSFSRDHSTNELQTVASSSTSRQRRKNVALSCAECRRLKLRCSRVFPCSNCMKKGCGAICPEGSLTTGKGNRFVLANTEVLHDKINQLCTRVRHLEDALWQAHGAISSTAHPLLVPELLKIKRPLEREAEIEQEPPKESGEKEGDDAIDAMGSLSISEHGRATFFGKTANSWYLLKNEAGDDEHSSDGSQDAFLSSDIPWLSQAFPFTSHTAKTSENIRGIILGLLPRASTAWSIGEIYYRHAAWMYTPISQEEFREEIFLKIYHPDLASNHDPNSSHRLAVLLMILAVGTLLDLDKPPHSSEAKQYFQLARAALSLESIFDKQSVNAIQALFLMCHYMFLSDIDGPRWVIMGLVVKMACSVGLHRDSGRWNLEPEETQKRRALMWEIYTYDSWQSLTFGRPPSFSLAHIDSRMAFETTKTEDDEVEMSFDAWKHRFSSQCLSFVHDQAFCAHTPSYKKILQLDKLVREFYTPQSLQIPGFGHSKGGPQTDKRSIEITMQSYIAATIKEMTLFYMHRGFFARAMEDQPDDPLASEFSPSVLAAYRSACTFVGLTESLYAQHPGLTARMWFLFTHVFSCAIVLGAIAMKSSMTLSPSASSHLESAYNLFVLVSNDPRAAKILPIIENLRYRAQSDIIQHNYPGAQSSRVKRDPNAHAENDGLSALGGKTRFISHKSPSSPSSTHSQKGIASDTASPRSITSLQAANTPPPQGYTAVSPTEEQTSWAHYHHDYGNFQSHAVHQDLYAHPAQPYYPAYNNQYAAEFQSQSSTAMPSPDGYYADPSAAWHSFVEQYQPV